MLQLIQNPAGRALTGTTLTDHTIHVPASLLVPPQFTINLQTPTAQLNLFFKIVQLNVNFHQQLWSQRSVWGVQDPAPEQEAEHLSCGTSCWSKYQKAV